MPVLSHGLPLILKQQQLFETGILINKSQPRLAAVFIIQLPLFSLQVRYSSLFLELTHQINEFTAIIKKYHKISIYELGNIPAFKLVFLPHESANNWAKFLQLRRTISSNWEIKLFYCCPAEIWPTTPWNNMYTDLDESPEFNNNFQTLCLSAIT